MNPWLTTATEIHSYNDGLNHLLDFIIDWLKPLFVYILTPRV